MYAKGAIINNNTKNPLVSVIMNCFNGEKYLKEAIDSVYDQTYKNYEIIFWDNASTDNSGMIARSYDNKLKYFKDKKTCPLGNARNKALQKASGEYIAFLDCDDLWLPKKLEKQLPLFYNNNKVAIVCSNTYLFNEDGYSCLQNKRKPKTGNVFEDLLLNYFINISTTIIRKNALDNLDQWFDSRFDHIEEYDLFLRLAYTWQLDYLDEPLSKYRFHKESQSYLYPERAPAETEIMLSKFLKLYPDFKKLYPKGYLELLYYINYYYSLIEWKNGRNKSVRNRLKPFFTKKKRSIIIFVLSFFPYGFFEYLYVLYNKYIRKTIINY